MDWRKGGREGREDIHVPHMIEGFLDKFPHSVALARGQDEVVGGVVLEHHPHASDIVARMAPVTLSIQIS